LNTICFCKRLPNLVGIVACVLRMNAFTRITFAFVATVLTHNQGLFAPKNEFTASEK
jgi:hypothetical protein